MYCLTLNSQLLINWNECLKKQTPKIWGLGEVSVCKAFCYTSITQFEPQSPHKTPGAFLSFTTGLGLEGGRSLARVWSTNHTISPASMRDFDSKTKRHKHWLGKPLEASHLPPNAWCLHSHPTIHSRTCQKCVQKTGLFGFNEKTFHVYLMSTR